MREHRWSVAWRTPAMPAHAFWYFYRFADALAMFQAFRLDGTTASLRPSGRCYCTCCKLARAA